MIKSIKNFLNKDEYKTLNSIFIGNTLPWYFHDYKVIKNDNLFQFTHTFVNEYVVSSNFYNWLNPIINKLQPRSIRRIKANLTFKSSKVEKNLFHTDFIDSEENLKNMKTAIYYVNSNNGYTLFENNKKELSLENKMVIFSSNLKHAGTTHTDSLQRIVLNFNYFN
jgi:hypothetical protein